jgi:hypothetical protein
MSSLDACPRCGRTCDSSIFANFFPVHTCGDCSEKFCSDCGDDDGTRCPACGSDDYSDLDKVYS